MNSFKAPISHHQNTISYNYGTDNELKVHSQERFLEGSQYNTYTMYIGNEEEKEGC